MPTRAPPVRRRRGGAVIDAAAGTAPSVLPGCCWRRPATRRRRSRRRRPVVFTEIMYHPVLETGARRSTSSWSSTTAAARPWRWRAGSWPAASASASPTGRAAPPAATWWWPATGRACWRWPATAWTAAQVLGDYEGELDNDGERLVLEDAGGARRRRADLRRPLPLAGRRRRAGRAASAGCRPRAEQPPGAPPLPRPFAGTSRTRPGRARWPGNWAASPLDGATPGTAQQPAGAGAGGGRDRSRCRGRRRGERHRAAGSRPGARALRAAARARRRRRSNISPTTSSATTSPPRHGGAGAGDDGGSRHRAAAGPEGQHHRPLPGAGRSRPAAPRCCPRGRAIPATGTPTSSAPSTGQAPPPTTCSSARRTGS